MAGAGGIGSIAAPLVTVTVCSGRMEVSGGECIGGIRGGRRGSVRKTPEKGDIVGWVRKTPGEEFGGDMV